MKKLFISIFVFSLFCSLFMLQSCKALRTITTSATYTQADDSTKVTTTIQTKTIEEYTGVRKK